MTLPINAIKLAAPPNGPVVKGAVDINSKWSVQTVSSPADKDYSAGSLAVGLQPATADQIVDIGPVIVYDLGQ